MSNNCANENNNFWLVFSSRTSINLYFYATMSILSFSRTSTYVPSFLTYLVIGVLFSSEHVRRKRRSPQCMTFWQCVKVLAFKLYLQFKKKKATKTNTSQIRNLLYLKIRNSKFPVKGFPNVMSIQNTRSQELIGSSDGKSRRDICISFA